MTIALHGGDGVVELRLTDDGGGDGQEVAALRELVLALRADVELHRAEGDNELVVRIPC